MTNKTTKVEITKETLHQFSGGIQTVVPDNVSLIVNNQSLTKEQVVAKLTDGISLFAKVADLKLQLSEATAALDAGVASLDEFVNTLAPMVVGMFGETGAAKCGIEKAKERAPLSTEQRALMKARNQATRAARGTMGKKQKAAIHGVVADPTQNPSNHPGQ